MSNSDDKTGVLEAVERESGPAPRWSVIWLHGLGADGHDFEPIVDALNLDSGVGVRYVFPHAPVQAVTLNAGMRMRAWYDIAAMELERQVDVDGILRSADRVARLLEREEARGIAPERIILAGFSQGGVVALHAALRYPRRLAGVVALSTYLPGDIPSAPGAAGMPVFLGHGSQDPIVSHGLGIRARDALQALGMDVDWRSYPIPHAVCEDEIEDISRWLRQRMG